MQVHRLALQPRRENVALKLLHRDDDDEDYEGVFGVVRDEGDEHGECAGDERSDDRDEPAEEGEDCQWDRKGNADDQQSGADNDRVDQAHQALGPDEAAEGPPTAGENFSHVIAGSAAAQSLEPGDELVAVLDEEERQHQDEYQVDQRAGGGANGGEDARADGRRAFLQFALDRLDRASELGVRDVERPVGDPLLDLAEPLARARGNLAGLAGDRRSEGGDPTDDDGDKPEHHGDRSERAGPAVIAKPGGGRDEDRADDERHCHREQDHPGMGNHPSDDKGGSGEDDDADAPTRHTLEAVVDHRSTVLNTLLLGHGCSFCRSAQP